MSPPLTRFPWFNSLTIPEQAEFGQFMLEAISVFEAVLAERRLGYEIDLSLPFWGKVRIASGCWHWGGFKQLNNGYGRLRAPNTKGKRGIPLFAHRYAYEIAKEPVPPDLFILHHCDNRSCCRPSHLYAGTKLENSRDAVVRGRLIGRRQGRKLWGESRPNHKLTAEDVRIIREARQLGVPLAILVEHFHVHNSTISRIATGKRWQIA